MSGLTPQISVLLSGLSDFWQRFFADKDQLQTMYAASEEALGQAYLEMVSKVLNTGLDSVPVFRKEHWRPITLRRSTVRYRPDIDTDYPYHVDLASDIRHLPFLMNKVYAPTRLYEAPQDFKLVGTELRMSLDLFSETGLARRTLDIEPVVYRAGTDGLVVGDVFTTDLLVKTGIGGSTAFDTDFVAATPSFDSLDVGRALTHPDPTNPTTTLTREVVGAVTEFRLRLNSATTNTPVQKIRWRISDTQYFYDWHVGDSIVIRHNGVDYSRTIVEILAYNQVRLQSGITQVDGLTGMAWSHTSATTTAEISLWAHRLWVDAEDMYLSFGYLINQYEPSSESYRALIEGVLRYYILGPTPGRIDSALNVMVGIPVIRDEGEVFVGVENVNTLIDTLTTDQNTYSIPAGSAREDLEPGYVFAAFESLTQVFLTRDVVEDPTWFYGEVLPTSILPDLNSAQRAIDPQLYDFVVGSAKWAIGDPHLIVGGDLALTQPGMVSQRDLFVDLGDTTKARTEVSHLVPSLQGKTLQVGPTPVYITSVDVDPEPFAQIAGDWTTLIAYRAASGTVNAIGDTLTSATAVFQNTDVGGYLRVHTSTLVPQQVYQIYDVLSTTRVRLRTTSGNPVLLPADPALQFDLGLDWEVVARHPLQSTTGYALMQSMLHAHIFQVAYRLNAFPAVPYPRLTQDLREVLFHGKPAYTYLFVSAVRDFLDKVGVLDNFLTMLLFKFTETMTAERSDIWTGTQARIGSFYAYSNPNPAWIGVVRASDMGAVYEIPDAALAHELQFRAVASSPVGFSLGATLEEWNGAVWVALGAPFTLTPGGLNLHTQVTAEERIRISVTVNGTASTYGIEVGYVTADETVIALIPQHTGTDAETFGTNTITIASAPFNDTDMYREMFLNIANTSHIIQIRNVVSSTTVEVVDATTSLPAVLPAATNVAWELGAPRRYAASICVGGGSPDVVKTVSGNYIVPWPVLHTLEI